MPSCLLVLPILAAVALPPKPARFPDAIKIYHCDFRDSFDRNHDRWPDRFARRLDARRPPYVKIEMVSDPQAMSGRCLSVRLNGGAAEVYTPRISVNSLFSYVLEGRITTRGLEHNRAYLTLRFYDEDGKLLETYASPSIGRTTDWKKFRLNPITPRSKRAQTAAIGLHVTPGDLADIRGEVRFDDLWLGRLPRMELTSNSPHNVYEDPSQIRIWCHVSGIVERDPVIRFELIDASSRKLATRRRRLEGKVIASTSDSAISLLKKEGQATWSEKAGYVGSAQWRPPISQPGFYRVRVAMQGPTGLIHQRTTTLAVVPGTSRPRGGIFGWALPQGDRELKLEDLVDLLGKVGVNWAKFPVWFDEKQPERGDALARFAEQLAISQVHLVGVLDRPPRSMRDLFGEDGYDFAAGVFANPKVWRPAIDPVISRLSMIVKWWQLGADGDTSVTIQPNREEIVKNVRAYMERFGQSVQIGLPSRWIYPASTDPDRPWDFVSLESDPPLTRDELIHYLRGEPEAVAGPTGNAASAALQSVAGRRSEPVATARPLARWVVLDPLPADRYSLDTRARDLVRRMLAAQMAGAKGVFISRPFDSKLGIMNERGEPGELLLPWRTTALMLAGATYHGDLELPGGSSNHVFLRGNEAVIVLWNETPTREEYFFGDNVRQVDIWGRSVRPEIKGGRQVIEVGPQPTFLVGANAQVARWRMAFQFDRQRIASRFGVLQSVRYELKNPFPDGVTAMIRFASPKAWQTHPRSGEPQHLKLAAGEKASRKLGIALGQFASSGEQAIRIDFLVRADQIYRFSVYRKLTVGLGEVEIELRSRWDRRRDVIIVEQFTTNNTDTPISMNCYLFATGRRRMRQQIFDLGRTREKTVFVMRRGHELVGHTLWLRAEQIDGDLVLYHQFQVQP